VRPYVICAECCEPYPAGGPCPGCLGMRRPALLGSPVGPEPVPAPRGASRAKALRAVGLSLLAVSFVMVGYFAAT
jgi:hypothetical protein